MPGERRVTIRNATPLLALDAVALDTETTGLDPSRARLIELGAVRIHAGRLAPEGTFRRLIHPSLSIPAAATAVHGIDDGKVADAPPFADVWREFQHWRADALVIGHSLGFDFAVTARACERAGLPWTQPRALDIRLLAEACAPQLPGYDVEKLAVWLGVEVEGRHSALGDAVTAARIFLAMAPHLRAAGIRTLAEAERACASLTSVLDSHHRAGWLPAVGRPGRRDDAQDAPRLDLYPYRKTAGALACIPVYAAPGTSLGAAIALMTSREISSLLVGQAAAEGSVSGSAETGIMTERDVMRALALQGAAALELPIGPIASRPLHTVPADALAYRAIGRMSRLKVRHLALSDSQGRVCGVISSRDLLLMRASEAIWLGDEIEQATDIPQLARAWAKLPGVAGRLRREGLTGLEVALLISDELRALTARAARLAQEKLTGEGRGRPPCAYAVAVLGSAGRGESLLAMDQDNALVFAEGEPDGAADRWFGALGAELADILHAVGVPYCPGGVMARNPQWRGSLATWRDRVAHWIGRSNPDDLLAVDIFFDLRGVYGELRLATALWRDAFAMAAGEIEFAKLLAEAATRTEPGLGLFGRLRTQDGRIDLKKTGLFGIVTSARVLAIAHDIAEHSTAARLQGVRALRLGDEYDLESLENAQALFLGLLVDQQVDDIAHGLPPSNTVAIKRLSEHQREALRAAYHSIRHLDAVTRDLLFRD
jgi:DNA polymerase-3 subunit epsilon/CBS domain-containing protein